jgi:hypothetical protein
MALEKGFDIPRNGCRTRNGPEVGTVRPKAHGLEINRKFNIGALLDVEIGRPRSYAGLSRVPNRPMTDTPRRPECRFR